MKEIEVILCLFIAVFISYTTSANIQRPVQFESSEEVHDNKVLVNFRDCDMHLTQDEYNNFGIKKEIIANQAVEAFLSTKSEVERNQYKQGRLKKCIENFLNIFLLSDNMVKQCEGMKKQEIYSKAETEHAQCLDAQNPLLTNRIYKE